MNMPFAKTGKKARYIAGITPNGVATFDMLQSLTCSNAGEGWSWVLGPLYLELCTL